MTLPEIVIIAWEYITSDIRIILGTVIALVSLFLLISESYTKVRFDTTSENFVLSFIGLTFGLILFFLKDWLIAIALSFFVLALYQAWQLRESPVWRELMITSLATYFVFLVGTIADEISFRVTGEETELYTGWAYNLMIYVFLIMALLFFGRRFVLVTRFMSPQVLYLTLFAFAYLALWTVGKFIPGFDNLTFNFLNINENVSERVIFLSLGPYEIIILLTFFLYFISGWLIQTLLGIKKTDNERVHKIVHEVKERLGIKHKIKIGYVKAPILNAMAYGAFFDQRIAFISSDLDDFTDDDIRGIVAHELAHNSRGHVIWLQLIASVEMVIKKAFLLPATTLDYSVPEIRDLMPFGLYFLISYGIIAFLLIFVRILEGDADRITKKIGYGKELAQALYKLEGFYQGIAGDFGLNVQLLTGKKYSEIEKLRFRGEAAITLYRHLYKPNRWSMFSNIFMSHPRTAYRIIAVADEEDDFSPFKGALLPYWLILPGFIRKKAIKNLNQKRDQFDELISERFHEYYGDEGVKEFLEITRMQVLYKNYIGEYIVAYDQIEDKLVEGEVTQLKISESICRPLKLVINSSNNEDKEILVTDYSINSAMKENIYILKNGKMGKLKNWTTESDSNKPRFSFTYLDVPTEEFESSITGKTINYLKSKEGTNVFVYLKGVDQIAKLESINLGQNMQNTEFTFISSSTNDIFSFQGDQLITELPPVLIRLIQKEKNKQLLTDLLQEIKEIPVIIYTKAEIEVGIAARITEIVEDKLKYKMDGETKEIEIKKIDYITVYDEIPKFFVKKHLSAIDRFAIWVSNRKEMKYIFP